MGGGLAIVNASEESYNKLKGAITGSTERMTYWEKQCQKAGLSQEETTKKLEHLQSVFEESKDMADALGISSTSLTKSISLLGLDGKVTSDNIENLFEAFNGLGNSTDKQKKALEKYGVELSKNKDGTLNYDKTIHSVVKSLRGKTEEEKKSILAQLGLIDSYKELNELSEIAPEKYDKVAKSIEATRSAAEKAEEIISQSLTFSAEHMASSLDDLGLVIVSKAAPALSYFCDLVAEVASLLAQGKLKGAFEAFVKGFDDIYNKVKATDIAGAIQKAISGAVTFITSGGLGGILKVGGEIIHQIAQGIIKSKDKINKGISSAIKQIAIWVDTHADEVKEAGIVILDAIKSGIEENSTEIHGALDAVAGVMNEWIDGNAQIEALAGNFADVFIDALILNTASKVGGKATEWWNAITSTLMNEQPDMSKGGSGFLASILQWLFPNESSAGEKTGNEKPLSGGKGTKTSKSTTNLSDKLTSMNTKELESFRKELAALQETANSVSTSISTSFSNIQNNIRSSMLGVANIVRNQFTNMTNAVRTQSLNSANIVRNQFISISNVVRNQATNARNAFTTQFISIKNVARVQAQEARNNITRSMISMAKVVSTQAANARNSFTTQMISIKNVARVQSQEAGRYMATGLAAGLRSGTASAVAAARSMVNQVNAVIRSTAKIQSPSKVTEEDGMYMAQGLALGFKKSMPNVYKITADSIKGLNEEVRATVNAEVAKITVNAKASSNNNIVNNSKYELRMSEEDINRLGNEMSKRPVKVETKIGEKTIVDTIAKPIKSFSEKEDYRLKRLEGTT